MPTREVDQTTPIMTLQSHKEERGKLNQRCPRKRAPRQRTLVHIATRLGLNTERCCVGPACLEVARSKTWRQVYAVLTLLPPGRAAVTPNWGPLVWSLSPAVGLAAAAPKSLVSSVGPGSPDELTEESLESSAGSVPRSSVSQRTKVTVRTAPGSTISERHSA